MHKHCHTKKRLNHAKTSKKTKENKNSQAYLAAITQTTTTKTDSMTDNNQILANEQPREQHGYTMKSSKQTNANECFLVFQFHGGSTNHTRTPKKQQQ